MSSSELQALLDAAVDAVILIDHRGRITAFNRSAERLFGYSSQELLGRNVSILMPAPHRSEHDGYLERYASTGVAHIIGVGREVEGLRQDGTRFPAFLSVGRVAGSDPPRFVGFVRDVTTERQALATIHLQERLMHVSRMATMGEMAAGIAHELNQPLSAIATYAHACERFLESADPDLTETRSSLHEIGEEALRAGDIIRHLRQLVGGQASEHMVTDLNELIEDISVLAQADARVHTTQLELDLAEGLPRVNADRVQLQQVLLNLVRNALEALQELPAAARKVTICTTRAADDLVEMSVSDNGPGLSPAIADRLFTPFVTTKAAGTGLGLAISRTIVQAHDGKIAHRVRNPSGACFFVRIPAVKDEDA